MIAFIKTIAQPWARDKPIYVVCFAILLVYTFYHHFYISDQAYNLGLYLSAFFRAITITVAVFMGGYFFYLIGKREPRPLRAYAKLIWLPFAHWRESLNFALLSLVLSAIFSVFTNLKFSIPTVVPFYLDPWLADIDEWLHFGHVPWNLTHSWFSNPMATAIINLIYNLWLPIFWVFLIIFMAIIHQTRLRQQVLVCFCLAWIINGNILAMLFSSVGPCFYDHVYADGDRFVELMIRLNQQNALLTEQGELLGVWALNTQNLLWENYLSGVNHMGAGISAAPSMHVTIASLIAMSLFSVNRKLGIIGWVYVAIIELGSVHLAWHYAIDGYLAILFTTILWWGTKLSLSKLSKQSVA
jgi:hypothetical protein